MSGTTLAAPPGLQVQIESRFMYVTDDFLEDVGVDLDIDLTSQAGGDAASDGLPSVKPGAALLDLNDPMSLPFVSGIGDSDRAYEAERIATLLAVVQPVADVNIVSQPQVITTDPKTVQFQEPKESVQLNVQPVISADRRFITLSLMVAMPEFEARTVSTGVSVPDGGTVVLGGLSRMPPKEADDKEGAPGITRIPLLGDLFKSSDHRDKPRLLVLITPRILGPGGSSKSSGSGASGEPEQEESDFLKSLGD